MQIRAATRQDEALIRNIIFQDLEERGVQPDPERRDSDLRNIEKSYFWHDGLCLVAEREGQVIGVLAGRPAKDAPEVLELARLAVTPGARRHGACRALLKTALFFAANLECRRLRLKIPVPPSYMQGLDAGLLGKLGFGKNVCGDWEIELAAECPKAETGR